MLIPCSAPEENGREGKGVIHGRYRMETHDLILVTLGSAPTGRRGKPRQGRDPDSYRKNDVDAESTEAQTGPSFPEAAPVQAKSMPHRGRIHQCRAKKPLGTPGVIGRVLNRTRDSGGFPIPFLFGNARDVTCRDWSEAFQSSHLFWKSRLCQALTSRIRRTLLVLTARRRRTERGWLRAGRARRGLLPRPGGKSRLLAGYAARMWNRTGLLPHPWSRLVNSPPRLAGSEPSTSSQLQYIVMVPFPCSITLPFLRYFSFPLSLSQANR